MNDGNVAQFGPTAEIYRHPKNLMAAAVFSDPPINQGMITKSGNEARLDAHIKWTLTGDAANLSDGEYTVAVRPYYVSPVATEQANVPMVGTVQVTELSGSESSAHFNFGSQSWVSLAHGVHPFKVGEDYEFFLDASRCFYFAPDGSLVA